MRCHRNKPPQLTDEEAEASHQTELFVAPQMYFFKAFCFDMKRILILESQIYSCFSCFVCFVLFCFILPNTSSSVIKCHLHGASLVAQWLGIRLPMQGTRVRALVWEDPTCRGTTRPVSHNY